MVLIACYGKIVWVLTKRIDSDLMKNKSSKDNCENPIGSTGNVRTITQTTDTSKDKFQLAEKKTQ